MATQREFPEWMITNALGAYLESDPTGAAWLFDRSAVTAGGRHKLISELCGFSWHAGETRREAQSVLTLRDGGEIPEAEFKELWLWETPDFRYWTQQGRRQLIIEAKVTPHRLIPFSTVSVIRAIFHDPILLEFVFFFAGLPPGKDLVRVSLAENPAYLSSVRLREPFLCLAPGLSSSG
jgi:hypothetical protein